MTVRERFAAIRNVLPRGSTLPRNMWENRHRGIVVLLWCHAVFIPVYAQIIGFPIGHTIVESSILPITALAARTKVFNRRTRTFMSSLGLLSASAILIHLSGGLIEMHFHFFVMVTVVALYQDWLPFLASIGYVFLHHGLFGVLDPRSVYNHPDAWAHPWRWAGIHALFITGISAVCLVTWRLNEVMIAQRARADERLRQESEIVETLHEVGTALATELELNKVVERATRAAIAATGADFGAFLANHERRRTETISSDVLIGERAEASFAHLTEPERTLMFESSFDSAKPIRFDDQYMCVRVVGRNGQVMGELLVGSSNPARFTEMEERILAGIGSQVSAAVDNAALYESERRSRAEAELVQQQLALMAEASRVLNSSLQLEAILESLARLTVPSFADACAIDLVQPSGGLNRIVALLSEDAGSPYRGIESIPLPTGRLEDLPDDHPVVAAIRSGEPLLLSAEDLTGLLGSIDEDGPSTSIVVPMIRRRVALGSITMSTYHSARRAFDESDVSTVEELARRAAVAVENAGLFETQRGVAETLQHSLLPDQLPKIPGIETAARYMPGGPGVEVGGDWYDVLELPNGQLAIVMGDVVGRGVPAASLMGQLRNALRAYAFDGNRPGEILRRLNNLLNDLDTGQMATLVCLSVDPSTGAVCMANAGHPPPLLAGPDGSVAYLDSAVSVPLGAVPGASYPEISYDLEPGSTLLLYTDGLVESRELSLDDGLERLRSTVLNGTKDPTLLCDVLAGLGQHDHATDDVAVLCFRLLPVPDELRLILPAQPKSLRMMRYALRRWLMHIGASEEETYEVLLAAGEAAANAVVHASGHGLAEFELHASSDGVIHLEVNDSGAWRATRPSTGGRGLSIMRELMDAVDVDTDSEGTRVSMTRALAAK